MIRAYAIHLEPPAYRRLVTGNAVVRAKKKVAASRDWKIAQNVTEFCFGCIQVYIRLEATNV